MPSEDVAVRNTEWFYGHECGVLGQWGTVSAFIPSFCGVVGQNRIDCFVVIGSYFSKTRVDSFFFMEFWVTCNFKRSSAFISDRPGYANNSSDDFALESSQHGNEVFVC
ncbi:hypothetical protein AVEN_76953-1 [Araneus ventricosus]|uniref:Uncharacterized protein n=1 Tax=Araneus ventricosus TaxID=182803 RepID=A0A4Y2JF28_ARAVE|nr:hypothetical protein AVEN_76953-1 [Araneus ventricosus]